MVTRSASTASARTKSSSRGHSAKAVKTAKTRRGAGLRARAPKRQRRADAHSPTANGGEAPPRRTKPARAAAKSARPGKAQGKSQAAGSSDWAAREKKLLQLFGPAFPRGKVYAADGSLLASAAAARAGLAVMAFAPRPDRMNWIYLSHGLSASGGHKVELAFHWKERENLDPAQALHRLIQFALAGELLEPGQVISGSDAIDLASSGFPHWMVCAPESLPQTLDLPGLRARVLMLFGITDAELQAALRVKAEIADGRKVLLEALKSGGVFPVSDPSRACLTRRRDFHRLWETAFRTVRGR